LTSQGTKELFIMAAKSNGKELAIKEGSFLVEMPDTAPVLGFDPMAENFNWREVLPSNYWNMEELEERKKQLGGWPVLTPARIVIKPVYDPAEWEGKAVPQSELAPKIVLEFVESVPALVFNKTRCDLATQITGTPNPARWATLLPQLELIVGVYNKKAQIGFEAVPDWAAPKANDKANGKANGKAADVEDINDDLFAP
jgi:hypothetical protein